MARPALQDLITRPIRSAKVQQRQENKFRLHGSESLQRQPLETYIANKFQQAHSAEIAEYMPVLLEMTRDGETQAALGLRPRQYRPMFLEQYLSVPTEQKIAELAKTPVDRDTLMEIGNLVVTRSGAGLLLFLVMALSIAEAGYQWMIFTATPEVTRLIRRLGFDPLYMADANPACIIGGTKNWGHYYDNRPQVMAGSLAKAMMIICQSPALRAVSAEYAGQIKTLSETLAKFQDHSF